MRLVGKLNHKLAPLLELKVLHTEWSFSKAGSSASTLSAPAKAK